MDPTPNPTPDPGSGAAAPASPASPAPAAAAAPRARRGWLGRLLGSLSVYLIGTLVFLALPVAVLGWLLMTEAGTVWLLARVPGLEIRDGRGSLLGGFAAEQLTLQLPSADGGRVRLQELRWSALRLSPGDGAVWLRIGLDELAARRLDLQLPGGPSTDTEPPTSLALPVGLDLAELRVDEFHVEGLDTPVLGLRARLGLAVDGGARHRVDGLHLQWGRLRLAGDAQVATGGQLAVAAALQLTQPPGTPGEWEATAQLDGPLAAPRLEARLQGRTSPSRPAQTLQAQAALRPFAAWPLGELQAQARALDLAALHDAAPRTALDLEASARSDGLDRPAAIGIGLRNHEPGRWNEGRLPVRRLQLELEARPDDLEQLEVRTFEVDLGTGRAGAGRLRGSGSWRPADWRVDTRLVDLQPAQLDARAPAMRLDGTLQLEGAGFGGPPPARPEVAVRGTLAGRLLDRGPPQAVQVRLDGRASDRRVELRELLAQAGDAQARVEGRLVRAAPSAGWSASGRAQLHDFDPAPWWPGPEDSPWRRGRHRLNASSDFDLQLPAAGAAPALQQLAQVRGRAELTLAPSQLAGVPISGRLSLQTAADGAGRGRLDLLADGNVVQAEARLDRADRGAGDHWDLKADLPALQRLQPLWRLLGAEGALAGKLRADARLDGRWPALASEGRLQATELRLDALQLDRAEGRWVLGSGREAPLDAQLELTGVRHGIRSAERIGLRLKGSPAAHALELRAESKALPPAWVEAIQDAPAGTAAKRTLAQLDLDGGFLGSAAGGWTGWRGRVRGFELRGDAKAAAPWLQLGEFGFEGAWADGPPRLNVDAGRARVLGAGLSWSRIAWRAGDGPIPAKLDAEARLEPLAVAPLLARAQPAFGWGGDLRLGGHLVVKSTAGAGPGPRSGPRGGPGAPAKADASGSGAPTFSADIVVERASGDLSVTDDAGTRTLGLTDLRVGLVAQDGVWSFSAGLAGATLGRAAGALVVQSSPGVVWPRAQDAANGVVELQIADLGVWGPWLPPGWRLTGAVHLSAALEGRFGAPQITGKLAGGGIGVRNVLQGVDVRDGEVEITLLGETARIEKFAASAGRGRLSLLGDASLGAAPRAELGLRLEQFQLLGRVDRRIVASGDATLRLGRDTLALNGDFRVDEGLIDVSRSDAPRLSDDVHVHRGGAEPPSMLQVAADDAETGQARSRRASLDLRVNLGEQLRVRGHGLDAGLRGDLRLTAPQGRLRVDGSVRTAGGTYRAYRQRLDIERGVLTFNGPIENPQLDIEAVRPNLDVRVGVAVTGTVLVPRVRLFSDPEMSDADRLSWLLRGRASEGPGSGDAALLQAAAMALLAGDEPTVLDQLFDLIGLDELSLRQSDSATGGTIFSVGKQLSRRWYVGYERGLNATTGNWQLVYRIAQRFTVRAQSGDTNSIELIWTWRWN